MVILARGEMGVLQEMGYLCWIYVLWMEIIRDMKSLFLFVYRIPKIKVINEYIFKQLFILLAVRVIH